MPGDAVLPLSSRPKEAKLFRNNRSQAGCVLGQDYPAPIVDHAAARERTLAAYQRAG